VKLFCTQKTKEECKVSGLEREVTRLMNLTLGPVERESRRNYPALISQAKTPFKQVGVWE